MRSLYSTTWDVVTFLYIFIATVLNQSHMEDFALEMQEENLLKMLKHFRDVMMIMQSSNACQ